jgi:hypothetical protein
MVVLDVLVFVFLAHIFWAIGLSVLSEIFRNDVYFCNQALHLTPKETWCEFGGLYGFCPRCGAKMGFIPYRKRWQLVQHKREVDEERLQQLAKKGGVH